MKEKIINIILTIIAIFLIIIIGAFGLIIYGEITGTITIKFEEAGYPTIEYNPNKTNNTTSSNTEIIIEQNNIETQEKNTKEKYLYNQLGQYAKIMYNKLCENIENLKTGTYTVEFGETFSDMLKQEGGSDKLQQEYQSAIECFLYENPEIFYIEPTNMYLNIEKITKITGVKYNVYINNGDTPTYLATGFYSKEEVDIAIQKVEQIKDQILMKVNGKTDYEKLKIIHDYLIDSIEYNLDQSNYNAYNLYGALVNKKCVCEGYAKAFQYLINELNIENVLVIGKGTNSNNETENHAWNYVKLYGEWYAIDVTWDDPIIVGGGNLTSKYRYKYFLKGSTTMDVNHVPIGNLTQNGQVYTYPTLSVNDYK